MSISIISSPTLGGVTFTDADTRLSFTSTLVSEPRKYSASISMSLVYYDTAGEKKLSVLTYRVPPTSDGYSLLLSKALTPLFPEPDADRAGTSYEHCSAVMIATADIEIVSMESGEVVDSDTISLNIALIRDRKKHGYTSVYASQGIVVISPLVQVVPAGRFSLSFLQGIADAIDVYLIDGEQRELLASFAPEYPSATTYHVAGEFSSATAQLSICSTDGTEIATWDMAYEDVVADERTHLYLPTSCGGWSYHLCSGRMWTSPQLETDTFATSTADILTSTSVTTDIRVNTGYIDHLAYTRILSLMPIWDACKIDTAVAYMTGIESDKTPTEKNNITFTFTQKWNY